MVIAQSNKKLTRKQVFESEPSPDWCPEVGEEVWVARLPKTLCWCVSRGVVVSVMPQATDPLICVLVRTRRTTAEVILIPSQIRPVAMAAADETQDEGRMQ